MKFRKFQNIKNNLDQCEALCPFECETITYKWIISHSEYPSYRQFKSLNYSNFGKLQNLFSKNNVTFKEFKMASADFFIYFNPMSITEITQSPSITFSDLISNIGGNLGLFIGISLLSFFELFEIYAYALEALIK